MRCEDSSFHLGFYSGHPLVRFAQLGEHTDRALGAESLHTQFDSSEWAYFRRPPDRGWAGVRERSVLAKYDHVGNRADVVFKRPGVSHRCGKAKNAKIFD